MSAGVQGSGSSVFTVKYSNGGVEVGEGGGNIHYKAT